MVRLPVPGYNLPFLSGAGALKSRCTAMRLTAPKGSGCKGEPGLAAYSCGLTKMRARRLSRALAESFRRKPILCD